MDEYTIKFELKEKVKKYDEFILTRNSNCKNDLDIKVYLIEKKLKTDICEICKMKPIWNKKPINLIIDRINNKARDNRLENLRIVCPNCYSQLSKKPTIYSKTKNQSFTSCVDCNKKIKYTIKRQNKLKYQSYRCKDCLQKAVCESNY